MIDQGQYEALIDQDTEASDANGAVAKDGIYSARAAARVFAETVVGELPGGGIAKQLFNLTADEFANRTGTPTRLPDSTTPRPSSPRIATGESSLTTTSP